MKIRYKYNFNSYINGPSAESLNLATSYQNDDLIVTAKFDSNNPIEMEDADPQTKWFLRTKYLVVEIGLVKTDSGSRGGFKSLVGNPDKRKDLMDLLVDNLNRIMRSIRNYGVVPYIQEIKKNLAEPEVYIRELQPEYSEDDLEYKAISEPIGLGAILSGYKGITREETPTFDVSSWPAIEEAIQDNLEPTPEQEFFTNAIEFLRIGNIRMALLESIIGLEIVLTQYLKIYYQNRKRFPIKRIKDKILTPQFGLTAKVAGLLVLTLSDKDLKMFDTQKILSAIRWRNDVVHDTGHIPQGVDELTLRDCISDVLTLSKILAINRDQLHQEPALSKIAQKVAESNKSPIPSIRRIYGHYFHVEISYFAIDPPDIGSFNKIASDLSSELVVLDTRFISNKHLYVRFIRLFSKTIAYWRKGKLEIIEEKDSPLPALPRNIEPLDK